MLYDTQPSPCQTPSDNFGEIEDYCINISGNNDHSPIILHVDDNPVASGTYHAQKSLVSTGTVATTTMVNYKAGLEITLNPNFEVIKKAVFEAIIERCN